MAKHRTKTDPRPTTATGQDMTGNVVASEVAAEPAWMTYGLRIWLVAMLGWTLSATRLLWTARAEPPLLPAFETPLAGFDYFGEALFAAFAAGVVWPRVGLGAYVIIAAAAMTADQTRMQPQIFSFALLMLGTWTSPTAKLLARTHLSSLWFFSGAHKLLSPGYYELVAPWLWNGIMPAGDRSPLASFAPAFGAVLALIEVGLGIGMWFPGLRKIVGWVALTMHLGIVAVLSHLSGWNTSVWGWNCGIAIAAVVLIGRWREPLRTELSRCKRWIGASAAFLFASPLLFYFGSLDAYLCHCLYSANVPTAVFRPADGRLPYTLNWIGGSVNVPLPPAHRLFEAYFRSVAKPGDRMVVHDPRWWAKSTLNDYYEWRCESNGVTRGDPAPASGKQSE